MPMHRAFLVAIVAILGCAKPASLPPSPPPAVAAPAPPDPREADVQAAYSLDAAGSSIESALAKAKALAPKADGTAKEALLNVADLFDSAGEDLADHVDPPPKGRTFDERERKAALTSALAALEKLRDAAGTIDDLTANAPPDFVSSLKGARDDAEEAVDAIEDAVKGLGGKVPGD